MTAADGSELASADFAGTQWGDWQQPLLTFTLKEETVVTPGVLLDIQPGGWGAVDDLYLGKLGDQAVDPTPNPPQEDNSSTPTQNQQNVTVSSTSKPAAAAAAEPAAAAAVTIGEIPQTGDTLPVAVLALLMVLSAAAMRLIAAPLCREAMALIERALPEYARGCVLYLLTVAAVLLLWYEGIVLSLEAASF